ncbi:Flagellar hook-length control protein FliK [Rubripirellula tenax]|uniref:Flagellar hook-length control protein FliK n=1 Tax=Rubripirellula tenax TaxID=2528015 RepID=A0A5C6ER84_9BACT|nr:flagellar hook-length control protein FliK [Rubripirellula tenax]TWU50904.1 Flagellar hook-length control protein FliK [Rubripirellula tenax]
MSDLETKSARVSVSTPNNANSAQRQQSINVGGNFFASADGLVDAFSEVFARMASSSTQPLGPIAESPTIQSYDVDSAEPSEATDSASESKESTEEQKTDAAAPVEARDDTELVEQVGVATLTETDETSEPDDDNADEVVVVNVSIVVPKSTDSESGISDIEAAATAGDLEPTFTVEASLRKDRSPNENNDGLDSAVRTEGESVDAESEAPVAQTSVESEFESTIPSGDGAAGEQDSTTDSRRDRRRDRRDNRGIDESSNRPNAAGSASGSTERNGSIPIPESMMGDSAGQPLDQELAQVSTDKLVQSVNRTVNVAAAVTGASPISSAAAATSSRGTSTIDGVNGTVDQRLDAPPTENRVNGEPKTKASAGSQTDNVDTLARIKLIQRVSKAFQHLGPDGGVVRLRLAPSELGTVRVEMRLHQSKIEARVVADTEAASAALREHLPELRSRLESFGLQVEKMDVETDPGFASNDSPSSFSDQEASSNRQRRYTNSNESSEKEVSRPAMPSVLRPLVGTAITSGVDLQL